MGPEQDDGVIGNDSGNDTGDSNGGGSGSGSTDGWEAENFVFPSSVLSGELHVAETVSFELVAFSNCSGMELVLYSSC